MSVDQHHSKPSRRLFAAIAMSVIAVVFTGCLPSAPAPGIVTEINAQRTARGLAPLATDPGLTTVAGKWASGLAFVGKLNHQDLGKITGWRVVGETIQQGHCGQSDRAVVEQWMASPTHRAILLSPAYRAVGVGTVCDKHNREWVVADFGG